MNPTRQLTHTTINLANLQRIKADIIKHSPHPKNVQIIAVTKTFSFTALQSAEKNKIFHIGENKVQETQQKIKNQKLHTNTQLHLIGHLQSNKTALAVGLYDVIQSVNSFKLLNKINKTAEQQNKIQKIFLQLNITNTPTQKGFSATDILKASQIATKFTHLALRGIMSIGPQSSKKDKIQQSFQEALLIQKKIQKTINPNCLYLSIGMSQDYILALTAGATHLRIGTILFQERYER